MGWNNRELSVGQRKAYNVNDHVDYENYYLLVPHVMTAETALLKLRLKFHSLFLQNSFDFQKSATFKTLQSSPRMY